MLYINAICFINSSISFYNSLNFTPIPMNEFGCPVSDITKSLYCKCFIFNPLAFVTHFIHKRFGIKELSNSIVYSESSGLCSSLNTSVFNIFSSATSLKVNIFLRHNVLIGVLNPGHNLLVGSHIWAEAID